MTLTTNKTMVATRVPPRPVADPAPLQTIVSATNRILIASGSLPPDRADHIEELCEEIVSTLEHDWTPYTDDEED